ncbi:hypothetical protein K3495_g4550 [Podosphaera aphanis]|nr:hypothetical protein K3495_g4550 [Podosphaera aphanis]
MGKKRKASSRETNHGLSLKNDPMSSTKKVITTYEDVADSEDEFHMSRDKVLLDDGPDAKRRKWEQEAAELEASDDEVLGYSDSESEASNDATEAHDKNVRRDSDVEVEEDIEGWGTSKQDYYNHDQIETEADALEEEAEARRLQQKKLKKMSAVDFGFDEQEWRAQGMEELDQPVVTEVIEEQVITSNMSQAERLQILQARYPEFEPLANELSQLQLTLRELQSQAEVENSAPNGINPLTTVKCRALAAYISTLSMYFAIIASPANGSMVETKALDPSELRDHSIMDYLLQCRKLWSKVKDLKTPSPMPSSTPILSIPDIDPMSDSSAGSQESLPVERSKTKTEQKHANSNQNAALLRAERMKLEEKQLDDLAKLLPKSSKKVKPFKTKPMIVPDESDVSDFGEEESMDAQMAHEKAQKKKSLRFYTSQIAQKANKRLGAGRDAGGDEDIPHRERLRDRQARLNAEAEKRGKRGKNLADEASDHEVDDRDAAQVRKEGDDYYDMIARTAQRKKAAKAARLDTERDEDFIGFEDGELKDDAKRAIGYVIEKNKGLAPKRKKDVRNPRVKKRKKFEEKKKKLVSIRAVYKGGEGRGGYAGEKTGIKSGLVKSIKL